MNWENPGPGIRRQIMAYDGQLMLVKVKALCMSTITVRQRMWPAESSN